MKTKTEVLSPGMYWDMVREILSDERAKATVDGVTVIDRISARLKLRLEDRRECAEVSR